MTLRTNTDNRGGIAKSFRSGLDFRVSWEKDGVSYTVPHNTSTISVKKMLEDRGVKYEEARVERVY